MFCAAPRIIPLLLLQENRARKRHWFSFRLAHASDFVANRFHEQLNLNQYSKSLF